MSSQIARHLAYGLFFIILDVLFFQHLKIFGSTIDPLVFYLIWLVQKYERTQLVIFTAVLALIQDAFFDFWGIMMFSKTLTMFIVYNFIKRRSEVQLLLWQIFLIILGTAIIHNIILSILSSFFSAYAVGYSPFIIIIGNSIYTALIGVLIYIFRVK
jgi:hypothetical protein